MIEVNLTDVHVTCTCVGVSCFRRKEKLLRYYPDKQNCEHSDDVMLAHGIPPSFTMVLYTLESTTMRRRAQHVDGAPAWEPTTFEHLCGEKGDN